jgi:hypothetical protein
MAATYDNIRRDLQHIKEWRKVLTVSKVIEYRHLEVFGDFRVTAEMSAGSNLPSTARGHTD